MSHSMVGSVASDVSSATGGLSLCRRPRRLLRSVNQQGGASAPVRKRRNDSRGINEKTQGEGKKEKTKWLSMDRHVSESLYNNDGRPPRSLA